MTIHAKAKRRKVRLFHAQDGLCGYCFKPLDPDLGRTDHDRWSVDHVVPKIAQQGRRPLSRNKVLVHQRCNTAKGGRPPTGCHLIALEWVLARMDALFGYQWEAMPVALPDKPAPDA